MTREHGTAPLPTLNVRPDPSAWWPGLISRHEWQTGTVDQPGPQRPSWCYGTPGIARAQQLAALALADTARQRDAEHTMIGCVTDDRQLDQLGDVSLCHGWAGLLHTTWRIAADAHTDLAAHLPGLLTRMGHALDHLGPPTLDGLMEGSTGLHLAQLTIDTNGPPASRWDACLLVDG